MEAHLYQFEYSKYFNYLLYLGCWTLKTKNVALERLFMSYRMVCFVLFVFAWSVQAIDIRQGILEKNLQKVTYNMSVSTIVLGTTTKTILLLQKTEHIDLLRHYLWEDYYRVDEVYNDLKEETLMKMKKVAKLFHVSFLIAYPACTLLAYFSYFWGPRELPFPAYFPVNYQESDISYKITFLVEFVCGILILAVAIETDLIVFSLLFQLSIQFKTLMGEIEELEVLYEDGEPKTNVYLRNLESERRLKKIVKRQITLTNYCKLFEEGFNNAFMIQLGGGSILFIMNGLQFIKMTEAFNQKLFYETVYLAIILIDVFFNCLYLTMIQEECNGVGNAAYSMSWYKMEPRLQKYVHMMIIHSQTPPKFTAGKLVKVDLNTFLTVLRNTYSWLMLFRQVEMK